MEQLNRESGLLNGIIRGSLNNRLIILVIALLLLITGVYSTMHMEVDVFPDLNAPTVVVMTEASGMAPEEVERLVTFPIETALNGATNVRRVRSASSTGFSTVNVEFDWGTDIYKARQVVSEKIAMVGDELPENVGKPTLGPQSSILGEMMIIGLTADTTSMQDLRTIADWIIRPRLLSTGGVAQVSVIGGDIKEYQILMNPGKMRRYGVSLDEVIYAVKGMNQNASGGILYEYGNEYIVRGVLSTNDIEDMKKAVVKTTGSGKPITLDAIADIKIGPKTPRLGVASNDGKPAIVLTVTKQPNVNTLQLDTKLESALSELQVNMPADVKVNSEIFRQSKFIRNSIDNVKKSLIEGGIFVVIVLFIFLMNWRTTIISLISIPLSIVIALLAIRWMGLTINTMSLGGIAIAIGSLVDDSIVDVENVFKRLRQNRQKPTEEQQSTLRVVYEASKEVRMPMLNSTLIIVASFLPLFFLSGMEGRMLKPLGITFIISLFASTLVALTVTPVLSSYLLGNANSDRSGKEPGLVIWLKKYYEKALKWSLNHKAAILMPVAALLVIALVMFFSIGRSFLPAFNEGSLTVAVSTVPGISLDESDALGHQAEEILLSIPEIKTVGRKTGRAELAEHSFGVNTSEYDCPFELGKRSKAEFVAEVRQKLSMLPGVNIEILGPIAHRIDEMLSGSKSNIAIKVFGTDLGKMHSLGSQIKTAISAIPEITDINVEQQVERPQLNIVPDREMLSRYGISLPEFSEAISTMLEGQVVSQVYEGNRSFDLTLKVSDDAKSSIERLADLTLDASDGKKVPLSYVADIVSSAGPNTINRENVNRKLVVSCNATGGELTKAVAAIKEAIAQEVQLPEGYHIEYGGQFESEQRASKTIALVSLFSIFIICMLLFGEFKNMMQTLVVLLNLPLALIGGIISIYFTDGILSIPAIIGFISLFGIATRNGMLLIDRYNVLTSRGTSKIDAVMTGSLDRLNPILMTAITSALALLPLAIGGDLPGNEIQSPMAKVILGGLFTSTVLNGFVIPIMYIITKKKASAPEI